MGQINTHHVRKYIPIFDTIVDGYEEINVYLKAVLEEYKEKYPESNESNVKAWHSAWRTHEVMSPHLDNFVKSVTDAVNFVAQGYFPKCNAEWVCRNMWFADYKEGDYPVAQDHWPSAFAISYYVELDENPSSIVFERKEKRDEFTGAFDQELCLKPQVGQLLIWPSNLMHEVPPVKGRRLVISANFDLLRHA